MKIRKSFVSNSSSSSFILAIRNDRCPTCGRGSNILEKIKEHIKGQCGDTELEDLNLRLKYLNDRLQDLKSRTFKEDCYINYTKNELKEEKSYVTKAIKELEMCFFDVAKYKSDKDCIVISCDVDYHDSYLRDMLANEKDITIIYADK